MMKKLLICALVAAVVAQAWGMVSWMVLPWHNLDFQRFKNESRVMEVFRAEVQGSGLYTLPNMDPKMHEDPATMEAFHTKVQQGPYAFMTVRPEGVNPQMGKLMAMGFLLNVVMAALLFWLVSNSSITCPIGRTVFIAVAATVGALFVHFSNWNWWYFPPTYSIVGVVDLFITWGLAGFVMVKLSDKFDPKEDAP